MKIAYVDTSSLVAIAFFEPGAKALVRRLATFDRMVTSNLTEAELLAVLHREQVEGPGPLLDAIHWYFPDRPLTAEYERVLPLADQKGADLFHLACALSLSERIGGLTFVSSDRRQSRTARKLGM